MRATVCFARTTIELLCPLQSGSPSVEDGAHWQTNRAQATESADSAEGGHNARMHLDAFTSAAVYTNHILNGTSVYRHATTSRHICCCMATMQATDHLIRYKWAWYCWDSHRLGSSS
jgi:hypothetical protein